MSSVAPSIRPLGRMVPLQPGAFRMPEYLDSPVQLLGARCQACGETFFPKRVFCAACSSDAMGEVELSSRGTVQTFTVVHQQLPGSAMKPPYAIVRVALPSGVTVQTVMVEGDLGRLAIDGPVDLVAHRIMDDDAGNMVISYVARQVAEERETSDA